MRFLSAAALAAMMALFCSPPTEASARLALLGVADNVGGLVPEELAAYSWAMRNYDAEYISLADVRTSPEKLAPFRAAWFHHTRSLLLPPIAEDAAVAGSLKSFCASGRGLLLSGVAPQLVVALGVEQNPPTTITQDPQVSGNWGFAARDASHPVFTGFPASFGTLSEGMRVENTICWWDDPTTFHGKWLADLEWSGGKVAMGEYRCGDGGIVVVGAGAFTFNPTAGTNLNRANLERLTINMFGHLGERREERTGTRASALDWYDNPTRAFGAARAAGKPLLVVFYTRDHPLCLILEKTLSETPGLTDHLRESYIFARIDVDSVNNKEIVRKFTIRRVPTTLVFRTSGEQAGRIEGCPEPDEVKKRLLEMEPKPVQ